MSEKLENVVGSELGIPDEIEKVGEPRFPLDKDIDKIFNNNIRLLRTANTANTFPSTG